MSMTSEASLAAAKDFVARHIVWDNHSCMPLRADDSFLPTLERCRSVGQTAITLNIGFDITSVEADLRTLAHFRSWVKRHPERYILLQTPGDVIAAKAQGLLAVGFDIEGACALGDQLSLLELYYDLGVRWMSFVYNKNNSAGGGCQDEDTGLTPFGRDVLEEMQRLGMLPCVSHTGWKTARQVLSLAQGPVIFSHSNAYAVHPHPRNIPDDLAKACAETGGVIGINGLGRFIGDNDNSTRGWFRHVDHMVALVGPEHVGVALDYVWDLDEARAWYKSRPDLYPPDKGYVGPSANIEPERLPALVAIMFEHGYPEDVIVAIMGGNHMRIAQVWK
ncbi:MAG: membrane dipeptidase [Caulobacteraceae bacterium]